MTSAHRPTWKAATGGSEQGGSVLYIPTRQYSSRDMPSHLHLKTRVPGQGTVEEAKQIDFKQDLLVREQRKMGGEILPIEAEAEAPLPIAEAPEEDEYSLAKYLQEVAPAEGTKKRAKAEGEQHPFPQDEDADLSAADEEFEGENLKVANGAEENKEGGEDEDEDAELMREFEKIKKEREEEQKRKEAERLEEQKQKQREDILKGNPIYNTTSYSLKKRWTEDTVFKNQARVLQKDKTNRFVNDIIRSDFHRKFLAKYIQ